MELATVNELSLAFPCVQLDFMDHEYICDVTIKKERGNLAILLFDYSTHYQHLHEAAQEKKTAMLNEQAHDLTSKYAKEKEAYVSFIKDRINNKIIDQLSGVVLDIEHLKKTTLSEEQMTLITQIENSIGGLRLKAIQIKEGLDVDLK